MNTARARLHLALLLGLGAALARDAHAHDLGVMKVSAWFAADGTYTIDVLVDTEHLPRDLKPLGSLPAGRTSSTSALGAKLLDHAVLWFDGIQARPEPVDAPTMAPPGKIALRWQGSVPDGATSFTWRHDLPLGDYLLSLQNEGDAEPSTEWLAGGKSSQPFALAPRLAPRRGNVARHYLALGYLHVLTRGLDQVLFVLALFLLSARWRPLLAQVMAFTVAYSITLALSMNQLVSLAPRIVAPVIALSIAYVALENLLVRNFTPWRVVVVFGFGLLHGMGLAGALRKLGPPRSQFLTALASFNVGVEAAQLSVIAAALLLLGGWQGAKPWYRTRVALPFSAAIAAVGLYFTAQRVFLG
ncbi:MAG: HupE/UreJ family protein [Planctomycetota bacterium]